MPAFLVNEQQKRGHAHGDIPGLLDQRETTEGAHARPALDAAIDDIPIQRLIHINGAHGLGCSAQGIQPVRVNRTDGPDLIAVHREGGVDRAAHEETVGGCAEKPDQPYPIESCEQTCVVQLPTHGGCLECGIKQEGEFKQSHLGELPRRIAGQNPGNVQHAAFHQFELLGRRLSQ